MLRSRRAGTCLCETVFCVATVFSGGDQSEVVANFGVGDDDEFADAGSESEFGGFPLGAQAFVEVADGRIAARCRKRGHVEDVAQIGAASGDGAVTASFAAIVGKGGDADQAGGLASSDRAEFAHVGDQGGGEHRTDAGHGDEQAVEGMLVTLTAAQVEDGADPDIGVPEVRVPRL
jgi:hypothetical protein